MTPLKFSCEIAILAGGLSTRMGKDKARLRLGQRTLLGHVRLRANALGLPVRVIRRDLVSRCGPLGGIYTALCRDRAESVLFLSCDMPFVSEALLGNLLARIGEATVAVFVNTNGILGFPFWLRRRNALPVVAAQLERGDHSLQALAKTLHAESFFPLAGQAGQLCNINTSSDWEFARRYWARLTCQR